MDRSVDVSAKSKNKSSASMPEGKMLVRFWNKRGLSQYLGISIHTIDAWVSQKRIPFVKLGGRKVLFDKKEIEKWIDEQKVRPVLTEKNLTSYHNEIIYNPE